MKNASTVASKWVRGMQNAGASAKDGVMAVTQAPGQLAAASADLYRRKVNEAVDSGRYQQASAAVSLESWRNDFITKGIPAMTARAAGAQDKVTKFLNFWLPITEQASQEVRQMPKGSLEDSKARMLRNMEILAGKKYKGR